MIPVGAMTHINDLRALMLEARIALRTALPDFDSSSTPSALARPSGVIAQST